MYNMYGMNPCPLYNSSRTYGVQNLYNSCGMYPFCANAPMYSQEYNPAYNQMMPQQLPCQYKPYYENKKDGGDMELIDYGPEPFAINIDEAANQNDNFRTALWTGKHLQLTLMSIGVGDDIGLEIHPENDQFIRIEEGQGLVRMGDRSDKLDYERRVNEHYAFIIPAGKWHNLINTGDTPIKLYSIYAPPKHPHGTVHKTKADEQAAAEHRYY